MPRSLWTSPRTARDTSTSSSNWTRRQSRPSADSMSGSGWVTSSRPAGSSAGPRPLEGRPGSAPARPSTIRIGWLPCWPRWSGRRLSPRSGWCVSGPLLRPRGASMVESTSLRGWTCWPMPISPRSSTGCRSPAPTASWPTWLGVPTDPVTRRHRFLSPCWPRCPPTRNRSPSKSPGLVSRRGCRAARGRWCSETRCPPTSTPLGCLPTPPLGRGARCRSSREACSFWCRSSRSSVW